MRQYVARSRQECKNQLIVSAIDMIISTNLNVWEKQIQVESRGFKILRKI